MARAGRRPARRLQPRKHQSRISVRAPHGQDCPGCRLGRANDPFLVQLQVERSRVELFDSARGRVGTNVHNVSTTRLSPSNGTRIGARFNSSRAALTPSGPPIPADPVVDYARQLDISLRPERYSSFDGNAIVSGDQSSECHDAGAKRYRCASIDDAQIALHIVSLGK